MTDKYFDLLGLSLFTIAAMIAVVIGVHDLASKLALWVLVLGALVFLCSLLSALGTGFELLGWALISIMLMLGAMAAVVAVVS